MWQKIETDPETLAARYHEMCLSELHYVPGTVDIVLDSDSIAISEETVDFLYNEYTPLATQYTPGGRPFFEAILAKILQDGMSPWEKARAITSWVANREDWEWQPDPDRSFKGGTEEEVIQKGGGQCNETSRVFCVMCQIAGVPCREFGHWCYYDEDYKLVGGHMANELHCDGQWMYVDAGRGLFVRKDGKLLSGWQVSQSYDLILDPPEGTFEWLRRELKYEDLWESEKNVFSPKSTKSLVNYFVADSDKYSYDTELLTPERGAQLKSSIAALHQRMMKRLGR